MAFVTLVWNFVRRRQCPAVHPHPRFGGRCEGPFGHGPEHYRTLPFGKTVRWFNNWQVGWEPPNPYPPEW